MSDGAHALWHKITNQLTIMGNTNQDEASSVKKSANGADQRTQIPTEKSKLGKHHSFKPTPILDIPIDRTR
jgi:hypothetical protein